MADNKLISQLLARWEDAQEQGKTLSVPELCGDHPELVEHVQRQIDALRAFSQAFRTKVPTTTQAGDSNPVPAAAPPLVCGHELYGELGRGGMGVVYKARQIRLGRLVALKMILAGEHAGVETLARFRTEAEAVARLRHPNIVQIHEVGEADGRPFLSLEFVEGGSLDRKLAGTPMPAREAARLVEKLARAMHYAHERGIVHRDLKPANVLLEADGTPRITDFGLAKRLDTPTGQTRTGTILGTPSYMAPEQVTGRPADVGPPADIYALGAILYDVLTGRPPFLADSAWDTLAQVLSEEPVPPTRLQPKVARDLETICLKCLHKDPARRYASALALADDLHRFLAGETIRARPVTFVERGVKWARRSPTVAALAALLVVVTAAGFGMVTWKWREALATAEREREARQEAVDNADRETVARKDAVQARLQAEQNEQEANKQRAAAETSKRAAYEMVDVSRRIVDLFCTRVSDSPELKGRGLEGLRLMLLQMAAQFYQEYVALRNDDPNFRLEQGLAYARLAALQEDLGTRDEAEKYYRKALAVFDQLDREKPAQPAYRRQAAISHNDLGLLYMRQPALDKAEQEFTAALNTQKQLAKDYPKAGEYQNDLATTQNNLGSLYQETDREAEAETAYRTARDLFDLLVKTFPNEQDFQQNLATSQNNLGRWYERKHQFRDAETAYRAAEVLWDRLVAVNANAPQFAFNLARNQYNLGNLYLGQKDAPKSETAFTKAIGLQRQLIFVHPAVADYQDHLALCLLGLGSAQAAQSRFPDAVAACQAAIDIGERLVVLFPAEGLYQTHLALGYHRLVNIQVQAGNPEAAEAALLKNVAGREQQYRDNASSIPLALELARAYCNLAHVVRSCGKLEPALKGYTQALDTLDPVRKKDPGNASARDLARRAYWGRALTQTRLGHDEDSLKDWDRALELEAGANRDPLRLGRAEVLARLGRHAEAAAEAGELAAAGDRPGEFLYDAARVQALAAAAVRRDDKLSPVERDRLAGKYALAALEALRKAQAAGFFESPENRTKFREGRDFEALRTLDPFKEFSAGLPQPD